LGGATATIQLRRRGGKTDDYREDSGGEKVTIGLMGGCFRGTGAMGKYVKKRWREVLVWAKVKRNTWGVRQKPFNRGRDREHQNRGVKPVNMREKRKKNDTGPPRNLPTGWEKSSRD